MHEVYSLISKHDLDGLLDLEDLIEPEETALPESARG
jgi:hypothetical protein